MAAQPAATLSTSARPQRPSDRPSAVAAAAAASAVPVVIVVVVDDVVDVIVVAIANEVAVGQQAGSTCWGTHGLVLVNNAAHCI